MLFKPSETCLVYHSADLERSARFYADVLGIAFERRGTGSGQFLFARLSADFSISVMSGQPQPGNSPLVTFTLAEGGIADVVAALAEYGATIVSPLGEAPDGTGAAFLDPDGHPMGLYQPREKPLSRKETGH